MCEASKEGKLRPSIQPVCCSLKRVCLWPTYKRISSWRHAALDEQNEEYQWVVLWSCSSCFVCMNCYFVIPKVFKGESWRNLDMQAWCTGWDVAVTRRVTAEMFLRQLTVEALDARKFVGSYRNLVRDFWLLLSPLISWNCLCTSALFCSHYLKTSWSASLWGDNMRYRDWRRGGIKDEGKEQRSQRADRLKMKCVKKRVNEMRGTD